MRFVHERGEADLLAVRRELPSLEAACGLDEPTLTVELERPQLLFLTVTF